MFRRADRTTTERRQLLDSTTEDEQIETKIKECQRENGRCMVSTSSRLKKKYGHEKVNRVLSRLSARRYRNNKNNRDTLHNVLDSFSI
jgi:hypothetical protein